MTLTLPNRLADGPETPVELWGIAYRRKYGRCWGWLQVFADPLGVHHDSIRCYTSREQAEEIAKLANERYDMIHEARRIL